MSIDAVSTLLFLFAALALIPTVFYLAAWLTGRKWPDLIMAVLFFLILTAFWAFGYGVGRLG